MAGAPPHFAGTAEEAFHALDVGAEALEVLGGRLHAEHVRRLAGLLATNQTLKELSFFEMDFSPENMAPLAKALQQNTALTALKFNGGWSPLRPGAAKLLARALKANSSLQHLGLIRQQIDAEAAAVLADAIAANTTIVDLRLDASGLDDAGVAEFAGALRVNQSLTLLDLKNTSIGDAGAQHLADALQTNSALLSLNLTSTRVGSPAAQRFADALRTNVTLTELKLPRRLVSEHVATIDSLLAKNRNPPLLLSARLLQQLDRQGEAPELLELQLLKLSGEEALRLSLPATCPVRDAVAEVEAQLDVEQRAQLVLPDGRLANKLDPAANLAAVFCTGA